MNKKQVAFNTYLLLPICLFILFATFTILSGLENEFGLCIIFATFGLLSIFIFVISPLYFVFSDEQIEIIYNFKQREQIAWSDIKSICLKGSFIGAGGFPHYVVAYPKKRKGVFFMLGEIHKTRKTKKIISKYYKKKIVNE